MAEFKAFTASYHLGWRPIETAPKDGTDIIVGVDIATTWIIRGAWYESPEEAIRMNKASGPSNFSDGWWSDKNSVTCEKLIGVYEPTHWIPMPDPPE